MSRASKGTILERSIRAFHFLAHRRYTTSMDLAGELGITEGTALRYLHELSRHWPLKAEPVEVTETGHGTSRLAFSLSPEWRKRHGFL